MTTVSPTARATRPSYPDRFELIPWNDQLIELVGFPPHHAYVELLWLPVVRPSASWLYRRLWQRVQQHADGTIIDLADLAASIGPDSAAGPRRTRRSKGRSTASCASDLPAGTAASPSARAHRRWRVGNSVGSARTCKQPTKPSSTPTAPPATQANQANDHQPRGCRAAHRSDRSSSSSPPRSRRARAWVASIWPSPDLAGWGHELWRHDPIRRGWIIPASCTHGTIVEVGTTIERRRRRRTHTAWYAIAIAHDQHWLMCTNPYPGPGEAHQHARQLTDCYRRRHHRTTPHQHDTRTRHHMTAGGRANAAARCHLPAGDVTLRLLATRHRDGRRQPLARDAALRCLHRFHRAAQPGSNLCTSLRRRHGP